MNLAQFHQLVEQTTTSKPANISEAREVNLRIIITLKR